MKIIAIEGLDKSGKHTQTKLLKERLEVDGYKVAQSEFHRYDTPTGKLIQQWLYGEYQVSQQTIELIMAADKYAQQDWMRSLEKEGYDFLLLDRYYISQLVYGKASGGNVGWIEEVIGDLLATDMDIFIDIPAQESMMRKGKHGDNDKYESDIALLDKVRSLYKEYIPRIWQVNGERPVETIAEDIYQLVKERIHERTSTQGQGLVTV